MIARRLAHLLLRTSGYPQEFLCMEARAIAGRFTWRLDDGVIDPAEIVFLGYRPLVLGLRHDAPPEARSLELDLAGEPVARIMLTPLTQDPRWPGIQLHGGSAPWQRFLPYAADRLDRLRQWLNMRQPGNVTGSMSEYDMLRIAYAQPREIHLAVVGPPGRCNIFPTDLHGPVGSNEYVISLRRSATACAQVQRARSLMLCRMSLDRYRVVYGLASRHRGELARAEEITAISRTAAGHSLPAGALHLVQLELIDHIDVGIHRLLRFTVKERTHLHDGPVLAHAHAGPLGLLKRRGYAADVLVR